MDFEYCPRLIKKNNHFHFVQVGRLNPVKLQVSIKRRPPSSATITINDDTHVECRQLIKIITPVRTELMYVKSIKTDVFNSKQRVITCEGVYGLLDSLNLFGKITPKVMNASTSDAGNTRNVSPFVALKYLENKASSDWWTCENAPNFRINTSAYTTRQGWSFNGVSLLNALHQIQDCFQDYECVITVNDSKADVLIEYVKEATQPTAQLRESRNMTSLNVTVDTKGMYNRLYVLGKNDLNIKKVGQDVIPLKGGEKLRHDANSEYIYAEKSIEKYGYIDHQESDTSKSDDDGLMAWGFTQLERNCEPAISITVNALELSQATGVELDRLQPGKMVRIPLPQYGLNFSEIISECSFSDLCQDPYNCTVTIANQPKVMKDVLYKSSGGGGKKNRNDNNTDHCDLNTKANSAANTANTAKNTAEEAKTTADTATEKINTISGGSSAFIMNRNAQWSTITLDDGTTFTTIVPKSSKT